MASASIPVVWDRDWAGYMHMHMECTLTVEATDTAPYVMTAAVSGFSESHSFSENPPTGIRFINVGGLMWYVGDIQRTYPPVTEDETWEALHSQLVQADPTFDTDTGVRRLRLRRDEPAEHIRCHTAQRHVH